MEADIEGIVEKTIDYKSKRPEKKSAYQIKQEEMRKNEELKHKHQMQKMLIMVGFIIVLIIICIIASLLGLE